MLHGGAGLEVVDKSTALGQIITLFMIKMADLLGKRVKFWQIIPSLQIHKKHANLFLRLMAIGVILRSLLFSNINLLHQTLIKEQFGPPI